MIALPQDVAFIIHKIEKAGFEAFAVGGCIRDSLLSRTPNDWDITTSALPEQVKALFPHTIDTGIKHGTVTVMCHHVGYEVTTYRIDGEYEDGRHPKQVVFTPSLIEDLKRRDFTINAMAYNDSRGLVDAFEGQQDLQKGVIRAVGEPEKRFSEDALRIMRAVRFAAQLGYTIEEETEAAMRRLSDTLTKISAERIQVELVKLLVSDHPGHMKILYETGITKVILPEFDRMMETEQNNPHHLYSVGMHTIRAMEEVPADKVLRLTMLFHDMGKPAKKTTDAEGIDHFHGHAELSAKMAKEILQRLKFDNDTIGKVTKLVKNHDRKIIPQAKYVRRALCDLGEEIFLLLLEVKHADVMAQSTCRREEKLEELVRLREVYEEIKAADNCFSLKQLAVSGKDLIAAGITPGPAVGRTLFTLLDRVLEEPQLNTKEKLLDIVSKGIF